MMNVIRGSIVFASIAALHWAVAPAFAQATSPSPNAPLPETNAPLLDNAPTPTEPELDAQTLPAPEEPIAPSCPAGQFASAFPDVRPEDWAYEAVNRLAIGPIRCFPL